MGVYQAGLGAFEAEPHKRLKVWVFLSSVVFKRVCHQMVRVLFYSVPKARFALTLKSLLYLFIGRKLYKSVMS